MKVPRGLLTIQPILCFNLNIDLPPDVQKIYSQIKYLNFLIKDKTRMIVKWKGSMKLKNAKL